MGIRRSQLVNMNQHYRRFSLDYFLDCQQRLGIRQIELWCGASHFWLDHEGTGDVPALKQKLLDHDVRVVSVTAPSIAYQYQYASQEPELLEYSFRYFSNAIRLAAQLGADRVVVNSGWGYTGEDESTMWNRCRDHLYRLCRVAEAEGILLVMESLRDDESNLVYDLPRAREMYRQIGHPNLKMMVDNIATGDAGGLVQRLRRRPDPYALSGWRPLAPQRMGRRQHVPVPPASDHAGPPLHRLSGAGGGRRTLLYRPLQRRPQKLPGIGTFSGGLNQRISQRQLKNK